VRDTLAVLREPAEIGGDGLIGAGLPVDRSSLRADGVAAGPERPLSLWRPFCSPDLGTGAASESGPVDRSLCIDEAVVCALAASQAAGDWAAGMSPLAAGVVVRALAVLWVSGADWRCPDTGGSGAADNAGAWAPVAAERPPHAGCWRLAAAVLRETLLPVLVPPNPRACTPTPPSTLFKPVADLGRLTLGGVLSSSAHSDLDSAQSSGPAAFPGGEKGGGDGLSEPVQGELKSSQALVLSAAINKIRTRIL
jgi:hypothetical protein